MGQLPFIAVFLLLLLLEPFQPLSLAVSLQAWLTEIHEYAQQDVVLMLLGNKVSLAPGLCQSLLFLPAGATGRAAWQGMRAQGGTSQITPNCSLPFLLQVDSAQDRVVKREDGEKLAKVGEVPEAVPEHVHRNGHLETSLTQNIPGSTWLFSTCHALPFLLICFFFSFKFLLTLLVSLSSKMTPREPPGASLVALVTRLCLVPQEYGVPFMETSAKSGLNVELAFTAIAK